MADPFIGRTIGKYRLDSEIGRGGMGVVYHGHQASLNRSVAIKVLPESMAGEGDFLERFRQEAQVIASLEHDNIVRIYDVEEDGGSWFIIMELIRGKTVRDVRLAGPLPVVDLCSIGQAVAGALGYAHDNGIVHRDVKSGNIMITAEGRVKLMDFGIARAPDSVVKTAAGTVLGTPEYMAPEQGRFGEVSPQTDIYSLGIVLYEMATGRLPFEARDPFAVVLKHVSEPVPSAKSINPSVPEWLEAAIRKALAKMPEDRFATALELEAALRARAGDSSEIRTRDATPTRAMPIDLPAAGSVEPARLRTRVPLEEKVPTTVVEHRQETVPAASSSGSSALEPTLLKETPPPVPPVAHVDQETERSLEIPPPARPVGDSVSRGPGWRITLAAIGAVAGVVLLAIAFWPGKGPDRPQGVGIPPIAQTEGRADVEQPPAEAMPEEDDDSRALGEEAHRVRLSFLLSEADRNLAMGNVAEAIRLCELILESEPEHEGALRLLERARGRSESPRPAPETEVAPREDEASVQAEPVIEQEAPVLEPEPEIERVQVDPKQRARELWSEARLLKQKEHYDSLAKHLDEILELDAAHGEARKWSKKVDRWIRSIEEDLDDDLSEWLDDLEEAIEDEDLDDLEELWRGRMDAATVNWLESLWEKSGSLNVDVGSPSTTFRDATVDFRVHISIRRKKRVIEEFTWNGSLERRSGKARFTTPLR